MELLVNMIMLCLTFSETPKMFSKVAVVFYISSIYVWEFFSTSSTSQHFSPHPENERNLLSCISLVLILLTAMKWYLVVVHICISLMVNDVECHFIWLLAIYLFKYGLMNIYVLLWVKSSTTYFVAQVEISV